MAFQKIICESCGGALIQEGQSDDFTCESCGLDFVFQDSGVKKKKDPQKQNNFSYSELANGFLKLQLIAQVKSITEVINILNREQIAVSDIVDLTISNNIIEELEELQEFENLETLTLEGNRNLQNINTSVTNFILTRIYRSKNFSLTLRRNQMLDYQTFFHDLKISDILPQSEWKHISIPVIEIAVKNYKRKINDAERAWNRSENSKHLKISFKTFDRYLLSGVGIKQDELNLFQIANPILSGEPIKNLFTLYCDKSPFDFGVKDFFENEDGVFRKYIAYPNNETTLLKAINQNTGFEFSELYLKQKEKDRKEKKQQNVFMFFGMSIGITGFVIIAIAVISFIVEIVSCVKSCTDEIK